MDTLVPVPFLAQCRRSVRCRFLGAFGGLLLLNVLVANAGPIPPDKPAAYPGWWFTRDVITPRHDNPAPMWNRGDYPAPDDFAVVNIGQLKQIAGQAAAEMNVSLPGGAGTDINNLIAQWSSPAAAGVVRDDYAVLNLGQLKTVASLFYLRLQATGYCSGPPWGNGNADDFAAANLGQLKRVFGFDLLKDSDGDGIPDWWEIQNGLNPNDPTDAGLTSPDGISTNLEKYRQALNPSLDSDGDGVPDIIEILQGRNPHKGAIADTDGQVNLNVFTPLD